MFNFLLIIVIFLGELCFEVMGEGRGDNCGGVVLLEDIIILLVVFIVIIVVVLKVFVVLFLGWKIIICNLGVYIIFSIV